MGRGQSSHLFQQGQNQGSENFRSDLGGEQGEEFQEVGLPSELREGPRRAWCKGRPPTAAPALEVPELTHPGSQLFQECGILQPAGAIAAEPEHAAGKLDKCTELGGWALCAPSHSSLAPRSSLHS